MRDALAHQGVSSGNGRHTREEIADKYGESPRQVARFIRLTSLNRPLLELVDRGKLQMGAAVEISYLDTETQCWVMDHFEATGRTPAIAQARELRRAYGEGALTQEAFAGIMLREEGKVAGGEKDFVRRMREEYFQMCIRDSEGLAFPALFSRFKIIHDFAVHPLSPFHADFSIAQIRVKINLFLMQIRIILHEYF